MDTVILKFFTPQSKFEIKNYSLFLPEITRRTFEDLTLTERASTRPYLKKFILQSQQKDEYIPQVELFENLTDDRKNICYVLKITFSVPKLLYWNSLQEVSENDGQRVYRALQSVLASVGIVISIDSIEKAMVSTVHACKNIPLPKSMKMRSIINELAKMDVNKSFDITDNKCKQGGRVLNIWSGTIDWSFYDKVSDCLRPKNKRSDKYHIIHEREIIEKYNLLDREVFRYEYRIKKNQTVKRDINKLLGRSYQTQVTFADLFTPNLMKTLVLNSWQSLLERPENQLSLFDTKIDKLELFLFMLSEANKQGQNGHSLNNALISYGLAMAIRDHGAKEVKGAILDIWSKQHPERLNQKIKSASDMVKGLPYSNNVAFLDKALEKFELITTTSLENGI